LVNYKVDKYFSEATRMSRMYRTYRASQNSSGLLTLHQIILGFLANSNRPRISICMPTYNGQEFLLEALDSIMGQDMHDIEVIISDDNSQDDTLRIVDDFKQRVSFPVHVYAHKPSGIGANWNYAISKSNGKYIKFLFQDDVLLPGCLVAMSDFLERHPGYGLVASKRSFLVEGGMEGESLKKWLATYSDLQAEFKGPHEPFLHLDKQIFSSRTFLEAPKNKVGEPSIYMFRKAIYDKIGPFREDLKQILDYEFCYRLLKKKDIAILPDTLVAFRIHAAQATNVNRQVDISDYRIYERLLYDEYLDLLHPSLRTKLVKKYHPFYIFKDKVSLKLRLSMKKFFP
jgi:glycosyltransferase involved in cell wall biosynthesis